MDPQPASPTDLRAAFALLRVFKQGGMTPGASITAKQLKLIRLLCNDLLPEETFSLDRVDDLIIQISRANTLWNRRAQFTVNEIYSLRESGKAEDAGQRRQIFLNECPSAWYRGVVEAI
jgi:hypothetical protein